MASCPVDERACETVGIDAADFRRYAGFTLEPGVVIVFDVENANAWLQSSAGVELDEMR